MQIFTLQNQYGTVKFTPYGGQVLAYTLASGREVLWRNEEGFLQAAYAAGKPLRGGVPVCWPWFRQHPKLTNLPQHGYARTRHWALLAHTPTTATLKLALDGTDTGFPHPAQVVLEITLTEKLQLQLTTTNLGAQPFELTQALHTYLQVEEVAQCEVTGLAGVPNKHIGRWSEEALWPEKINLDAAFEHIFYGAEGPLQLEQANKPMLQVGLQGTNEVVLWNPWAEKAQSLDMLPKAYQHFLCIEAANLVVPVVLAPQQSYTLGVMLRALV